MVKSIPLTFELYYLEPSIMFIDICKQIIVLLHIILIIIVVILETRVLLTKCGPKLFLLT